MGRGSANTPGLRVSLSKNFHTGIGGGGVYCAREQVEVCCFFSLKKDRLRFLWKGKSYLGYFDFVINGRLQCPKQQPQYDVLFLLKPNHPECTPIRHDLLESACFRRNGAVF